VLRLVLAALFACLSPLALAQGEGAKTPADATAERPIAGKVVLIEGDVRVYDRNQGLRRPKLDDSLYEGDSIVTGDGGEVHFDMEDGGYIGVRPDTQMRIANYKAEGGPDDQSVISLLQGSFRSITGWIGKLGGSNYRIVTRTVTIGVRGTEHEPHVIPEGSAAGEPGTYDRVHSGETLMQTPKGTVNIRANQAGFMPLRGDARPRVLDRIPAFFRPTRNEGRFQACTSACSSSWSRAVSSASSRSGNGASRRVSRAISVPAPCRSSDAYRYRSSSRKSAKPGRRPSAVGRKKRNPSAPKSSAKFRSARRRAATQRRAPEKSARKARGAPQEGF